MTKPMKTIVALFIGLLMTAHIIGYLFDGPEGVALVFGLTCTAALALMIFVAVKHEAEEMFR
jgi:hypothetical protein